MDLQTLWFVLIAVLWAGYFLLEGFDFGVGMLLPFVPRDDEERSTALRTIGPVWDGNEVWLVVAGGATFAAFPAWYATMFSGFYLALLLILFFLIVRVVSFEWRSKSETPGWRATWTWANTIGSFGASLLWGIGLSSLLYGIPIESDGDFTGNVLDLFSLYTVFAGIAVVALFAFHGATYLTLRTQGDLHERSEAAARTLAIPAAILAAVYLAWTVAVAMDRNEKDLFPPVVPAALGIAALVLAVVFVYDRSQRPGLRDDRRSRDRARRDAVHRPLSARHGLEHGIPEQPHRGRRLVDALRAGRHERRRPRLRPGRAPVPGLDVLRLPPAGRRGARAVRSPPNGARPRSAPPPPCARGPRPPRDRRGAGGHGGAARPRAGGAPRARRRTSVRRRDAPGP